MSAKGASRGAGPEDLARVRNIVGNCGGLVSVQKTAQKYIERAVERLEVFPAGAEREALRKLAGFVVERHT